MRIEAEKVESFSSTEINPAHKQEVNKAVNRYGLGKTIGTEDRTNVRLSGTYFFYVAPKWWCHGQKGAVKLVKHSGEEKI